jgi:DNA-binding NtrC family response regulator
VRVVAATNRDLEKAVRHEQFRRDLYFRLHVVEILVPPLREHREDVPVLAQHFLETLIHETGRKLRGFSPEGLQRLSEHDWPGNVRELKNVVERAVVFSRGPWVGPEDVLLTNLHEHATPVPRTHAPPAEKPLALSDVEKQHIAATLDLTGWNKKRSAEILGIERSTLDRKIKRYKIAPPEPSD